MNDVQTIRNTEVAMMAGRRLSPRQIGAYKDALRRANDDGYIEVLILLFAEAMSETYDREQTAQVMRRLKELQNRFTEDVADGLMLDDLIVRVYEKTGLIFPMEDAEEEYIKGVLRRAGYDVEVFET